MSNKPQPAIHLADEKQRCNYEKEVLKFFGKDENFDLRQNLMTDYEMLVNLVCVVHEKLAASRQAGMRGWVKASERLPELKENYVKDTFHCRRFSVPDHLPEKRFTLEFYRGQGFQCSPSMEKEIEWLDETPGAPSGDKLHDALDVLRMIGIEDGAELYDKAQAVLTGLPPVAETDATRPLTVDASELLDQVFDERGFEDAERVLTMKPYNAVIEAMNRFAVLALMAETAPPVAAAPSPEPQGVDVSKMGDDLLTQLKTDKNHITTCLDSDNVTSYNTGFHDGFEKGFGAAWQSRNVNGEKEACEFAEWIMNKTGLWFDDDVALWNIPDWNVDEWRQEYAVGWPEDQFRFTTAELYQLFKQHQ